VRRRHTSVDETAELGDEETVKQLAYGAPVEVEGEKYKYRKQGPSKEREGEREELLKTREVAPKSVEAFTSQKQAANGEGWKNEMKEFRSPPPRHDHTN
jgi:hypothetical protein